MRKWLVLFSYCGASFINGLAWATLIPIPSEAKKYYHIGNAELTLYSYSSFIISMFTAPVSAWVITKSFYISMHIISLLNFIGCLMRYLVFSHFWLSLTGQSIIQLGNMLMLASCTTLASTWFPSTQLILATAIGASFNFIGMGFAFAYVPYSPNISDLMLLQLIISSFFWVFTVLVLRKDLKKEKTLTFNESIAVAFKNKNLVLLTICSGSGLGVNYSLTSILGLLLSEHNYSITESGWLGFSYLLSGLIGSLIATYIADVKKSTKLPTFVFLLSSIFVSAVFSAVVPFQPFGLCVSIVFGTFITGALPLCIRTCVDYVPDIHESIATNMIYVSAQVFSSVYVYPLQYFNQVFGISGFWAATFLILLSFVGILIFLRRNHSKPKIRTLDRINQTPNSLLYE